MKINSGGGTDININKAGGTNINIAVPPGPSFSISANNIAYTWFGRPTTAHYGTKSWIGVTKEVIGTGYTQHIIEYNETANTYTATQVGTVYEEDDHNMPSVLVRSLDNRLLIAYTEHDGAKLRLRISTNPTDSSSWGSEFDLTPEGGSDYTYPSLYQLANGNIVMIYRFFISPASLWYSIQSTDGGVTWGTPTEFYTDAYQLYLIPTQSDINANIIHFVASSKHPMASESIPNSVYHFYADFSTNNFYKSDGTNVTSSLPLAPANITPVSIKTSPDTSWIDDVITVSGVPRILFTNYPNGIGTNLNIKDLYYAEWNGSSWTTPYKIATCLIGYIESGSVAIEYGYVPASRFDTNDTTAIWTAIQVAGILEIHKVTRLSSSSFSIQQITYNSTLTNWRPIIIKGGNKNKVMWLRNNYYVHYTNFNIDLIALN